MEGEKDLLSGVVACSGSDGAKEKSEVAGLLEGVAAGVGLKVKGLGAGVAAVPCSSGASRISFASWFVAAEVFLLSEAGFAASGLAKDPNENGELPPLLLLGTVGTKPPPDAVLVLVVVEELGLSSEKDPTAGGAGAFDAVGWGR